MTSKNILLSSGQIACCWIALVSSLAWAQTSALYADLVAKSASLSPDQKSKAAQLFSTGFSLWQGGDFQAALIAFQKGLNIDPANSQENYYYADSLKQAKQRKEATEYFKRASALGEGSPEGFKAEAALKELAKPPSIAEMTADELRSLYLGTWYLDGSAEHKMVISESSNGELKVALERTCWWCSNEFEKTTFDGRKLVITWPGVGGTWTFRLTSPTQLEGLHVNQNGQYPMSATRNATQK